MEVVWRHRIEIGLRHPRLALEYVLLGSKRYESLHRKEGTLQNETLHSVGEVDRFHELFYNETRGKTWEDTYWFGVPLRKNPMDLWVYQETIFEVKPDVIIESGTFRGGSALFFASLFDLMGNGEVITIDTEAQPQRPSHKRITYLTGSSTSGGIVSRVREMVKGKGRVLVSLDSDHSKLHVLEEMNQYSKLVTEGSYLTLTPLVRAITKSDLDLVELTLSEPTFIGKIASPFLRYERLLVGFRAEGRQKTG